MIIIINKLNMYRRRIFIEYLILIFILLGYMYCDSVCDEDVLIMELKQDLEDNGILDCLRVIKPPNGVIETAEQKNKRLAAQWDSSCSFESTYDWEPTLKRNFDISTLVDEIGEPVEKNRDNQADMCEIIRYYIVNLYRSAVAAGLFAPITSDVTDIPLDILNYIDCPGDVPGREICAVNGIAFHKSDMWTIMLDGMIMKVKIK